MNKNKISLFINGEVLRIENGNRYLMIDEEWDVLKQVTKEEFVDFLQNTINWAKDSWNKELREEYTTMCKVVGI